MHALPARVHPGGCTVPDRDSHTGTKTFTSTIYTRYDHSNAKREACKGEKRRFIIFIIQFIIQFINNSNARIYKDAPAPQVVITNLGGAGEREKNETASAKKKSDRKAKKGKNGRTHRIYTGK